MFSLFQSCALSRKYKKEKDPLFWLFIDLDGTIFNIPQSVEELESFRKMPHLTEISLVDDRSIFMIYQQETRETLKELLALGVKLVVITASTYERHCLELLERILPLETGALKDTIFMNANYLPSIWHKGLKMKHYRKKGIIGPKDFALLLDNMEEQVQSAIDCGFAGMIASGFRQEVIDNELVTYQHPNKGYLRRLVEIFTQKINEAAQLRAAKSRGFIVEHANIRFSASRQIVVRPDLT